jgi:predicted AAA+ superfamily ATPase
MTLAYRPRVIDAVLTERLTSAGAVVVEGPKACGKTFTAEQIARSRVYLDTDPAALAGIRIDPSLVLHGDPPELVDEWQVEGTIVWNYVRREVDRRSGPGQFILTGSAVPADDVARHSGAGRFARLRMRPMTLFETGESNGVMSLAVLMAGGRPAGRASGLTVPDLVDATVRGGWPRNLGLTTDQAARANADYLANAAEVDIPRLDGTFRDPERIGRFLQALGRNTAMEHKLARLVAETDADTAGALARTTGADYQGALQRLMILETQPAWAPHLRSRTRLREAARTHFVDPSLAAAALGAGSDRWLADLNAYGLLFESLVIRDLRVYADALDATVYHYRDAAQLEVDAIVQTRAGAWGAFEVKLGAALVDEAAAHLLALAAKVDAVKTGTPAVLGVVTATPFGYTRPDGVVVIPIGALGP